MIKRLFLHKDLFFVFIWREFTIRYRHAVLGILWAVVQPLSMMILFTVIFKYIINMSISDYPHILFFFSALLPWNFFSSSLTFAIPSFTDYYNLITKIYFPKEIIPLAGIMLSLVDYMIGMILFGILLVIYKVHLTWSILWLLPLMILLIIFTVSVALLLASLNVYYRDVKLAAGFLVQLWFFASPIMYSIDHVNIKLKLLLFLNPLTFIIENIRRCVLEGRSVVIWQFILVTLLVSLIYFISYRFYLKIERAFADVI